MRLIFVTLALLWGSIAAPAGAQFTPGTLEAHILGTKPVCVKRNVPTFIITDPEARLHGEIDDWTGLLIADVAERQLGCINIIGVASVFGNGPSTILGKPGSTKARHQDLTTKLPVLGLNHWLTGKLVFRGPNRSAWKALSTHDKEKLLAIGVRINQTLGKVDITEMGPATISAQLLRHGIVSPEKIRNIYLVGGRTPGEVFASKNAQLLKRGFAFVDLNVWSDTKAVAWLIAMMPEKLVFVTYSAGIGKAMVTPEMVSQFAPVLAAQAFARAKTAASLGHEFKIWIWDNLWLTLTVQGGYERLSCHKTKVWLARDVARARDTTQLWYGGSGDTTVCNKYKS